ncbi:hypothetical protein [Dysgonomonas sp. 520]|uniref:hypothetical protein n=1 Tax=Dysgonomonas sp. 520 TaxID=2302931 RepID=UPI0013D0B73E|nr:hypothetical protein [Dysgonomonas sp. 520]NDW11186.1 hypothetical protein [Dysgonomonas sp. 520]
MEKKIFFIILSFCLISCIQIETKDMSGRKTTNRSKDEDVSKITPALPDSIIKIEEKKAIANIMFGINKAQYKQEEKKFLKDVTIVDSHNYQLGEYEFFLLNSKFYDGGLYFIDLYGSPYNARNQYKVLYELLETKYNKPQIKNDFPDNLPSTGRTEYTLAKWNIGKKIIDIVLFSHDGERYSIHLYSYIPKVKELAEKLESEKKNIEKEKNASKAIDLL